MVVALSVILSVSSVALLLEPNFIECEFASVKSDILSDTVYVLSN